MDRIDAVQEEGEKKFLKSCLLTIIPDLSII